MNIVELAADLIDWVKITENERQDYHFESIDSEDVGIIWIKQTVRGLWKIGSVWKKVLTSREYKLNEINEVIMDYWKTVKQKVFDNLRIELNFNFES
jgi:hypothetical protein